MANSSNDMTHFRHYPNSNHVGRNREDSFVPVQHVAIYSTENLIALCAAAGNHDLGGGVPRRIFLF